MSDAIQNLEDLIYGSSDLWNYTDGINFTSLFWGLGILAVVLIVGGIWVYSNNINISEAHSETRAAEERVVKRKVILWTLGLSLAISSITAIVFSMELDRVESIEVTWSERAIEEVRSYGVTAIDPPFSTIPSCDFGSECYDVMIIINGHPVHAVFAVVGSEVILTDPNGIELDRK